MLHTVTETFLKHQAIFFGVAGVVVAALLWFVLLWVRRLSFSRILCKAIRQRVVERGGGGGGLGEVSFCWERARCWGACSAKGDPVAATTVLGMPPLTCDHHSRKLILFLHGWSGDRQDTWKLFPYLVCGDYDFRDYDVLSIGYPLSDRGNLTMEGFGGWAADKSGGEWVGTYDQIVIVAHSIGGLWQSRLCWNSARS